MISCHIASVVECVSVSASFCFSSMVLTSVFVNISSLVLLMWYGREL